MATTYVWHFRPTYPATLSTLDRSTGWTPFDPMNQSAIERCFIKDRGRDGGIQVQDSHFAGVVIVYPRDGWLRQNEGNRKVYVKSFEAKKGRNSERPKDGDEKMMDVDVDKYEDVNVNVDEETEDESGMEIVECLSWDPRSATITEKPWWL